MSTLRNALHDLATTFADQVLKAIRAASLQELMANQSPAPARRGPGRPPKAAAAAAAAPSAPAGKKPARARKGTRGRRSAGDIAALATRIVDLVSKSKGLRAEQIRETLGVPRKALPLALREALSSKKISKKGQKRATTYFGKSAK